MQFHAVALLHGLRSQDRLAVSKLVTSLVRGSVRSPLAQCLLVRYVAQVRALFSVLLTLPHVLPPTNSLPHTAELAGIFCFALPS